ncbi:MAG: biopolymer transporter ExbD [Holophagales bacterium]|jgi:biopolymer transport protein ExbD|nr:biopolymer transporter ExbD [Holophagales bacterium]
MSTKTDINVTPLIDIVLVLLIIFIVMVPGMQKSMPTVIPQVRRDITPPPPDSKNPPLVVDINQDNSLAINTRAVELREIPEQLAPLVMLQPAGVGMRKVFLNVDRDVPYKWVVQVMDQLRVTSDKVRKMTLDEGVFADDGGETKMIVKLKRRPGE